MSVSFASHGDVSSHSSADECLTIGLVNNMGDEAIKATERQYISLLNAASDGIRIQLSFYTLPGIPRSAGPGSRYATTESLWQRSLDGLIVTGREPMATHLADEPYWQSFGRLLAWAEENVSSSIWSCLAAHAAILHMDGIERVKRADKLFGIFSCDRVSSHPLSSAIPASFRLPHSRWNGVSEKQLTDSGYSILTRGGDTGVDTFVKQQKKLFVFFQGHPEYECDTLLREYRRDVGRFFRGEMPTYPSLPQNYFDAETSSLLTSLQKQVAATRSKESFAKISDVLATRTIESTWNASALGIYRSWLLYLRQQKQHNSRQHALDVMADLEQVS